MGLGSMGSDILRNFYYMDPETIDNYISSIEDGIYDSADISEKVANNKKGAGGLASLVRINVESNYQNEIETRRKMMQTYAGKFQKIFSYLEKNGGIPFYDYMDDETWNNVSRNKFVELEVTLRFSKVDVLISSIDNRIIPLINEDGQNLVDDTTKKLYMQSVDQIKTFRETDSQGILPVELQLINESSYKFVSYFYRRHFSKNLENIPNEVTVFAKIQRKLNKTEKVNFFNIISLLEKTLINSDTEHINKLPEEYLESIKGPGALVIPIAIYN
jgi:hypothetical protein